MTQPRGYELMEVAPRAAAACTALTEPAAAWRSPSTSLETFNLTRLAEVTLAASGVTHLSHVEEQALDLRVPRRRRSDSCGMSSSPLDTSADSPAELGYLSSSPAGEEIPRYYSGSPAELGYHSGSSPALSAPSPVLSYVRSPPSLRQTSLSPPLVPHPHLSPADPVSSLEGIVVPRAPVTPARHTSVIRRLVPEPEPELEPEPEPAADLRRREEPQHTCEDCGRQYSTASNLARHRQVHCTPADKKARKCPECDKIYVSMPAYSMHVRTHAQGCRCPYCGKSFSRPWLLQGHIRTHTGERPFRCQLCGKAFADKSNLRAHTQTHSGVKPHVCLRCGKAFALKSYLYKHEESSCMKEKRLGRSGGKVAAPIHSESADVKVEPMA